MTGKKQNTKGRQRPAIRQYVIFDLGGVGLAVLVMLAIFVVFMRLYYYDSVRRALESPVQGESAERYVQNLLNKNNGDFLAAAQEYVRTFPQKDKMEVWVLDDDGRVAVTSSGFPVKAGDMRDYTMAVHAPDGKGFDILRYHGEPVYAFTYRLNGAGGKFYAMRFMISLRGINRQLVMVALACGAAWLALAVLLLISLWLCERWITKPVTQLSAAAAKIAEGDYKTRVHLPQAPHEINMLAQDISHMTARIEFAEKTKLDFMSTISHELRTPLTAIKGWGETLRQEQNIDGSLNQRGLGIIIEESLRLSRLVEELLDFSRIQSNRLVLNRERMDILAELDDVAFFFRARAVREGVALECNTTDLPAPLFGDPARIRQVFINLLDNAFKHTPAGGTVTIDTDFAAGEPPQTLYVTIADTGGGVSAEDLPYLTEKFFKASTSTKGSGIGLSVVSELLKAHGCALALESELGQGFTAHITFPLTNGEKK